MLLYDVVGNVYCFSPLLLLVFSKQEEQTKRNKVKLKIHACQNPKVGKAHEN